MGTAFLYGNGGSGGTGATLTVTAPAGCTVTVSKDGKTKTRVADSSGVAVFKGLATGDWMVTISDGEQTAQKTVTVTADYSTAITFFSATIHVTYPAGSTCTATDGTTTLTSPDTSGTWACTVGKAGAWSIAAGDWSADVVITTSGQTETVRLAKWIVKDGIPTDIGFATSLIAGRTMTVTQGDGYTKYKNDSSNQVSGILSDAAIDLGNARTVLADIRNISIGSSESSIKFNGTTLALTKQKAYNSISDAVAGIDHYEVSRTTGRQTLSIDAASISGSWFVGFAVGQLGEFDVYDLWMEV